MIPAGQPKGRKITGVMVCFFSKWIFEFSHSVEHFCKDRTMNGKLALSRHVKAQR